MGNKHEIIKTKEKIETMNKITCSEKFLKVTGYQIHLEEETNIIDEVLNNVDKINAYIVNFFI